jgi:hypothetical protein
MAEAWLAAEELCGVIDSAISEIRKSSSTYQEKSTSELGTQLFRYLHPTSRLLTSNEIMEPGRSNIFGLTTNDGRGNYLTACTFLKLANIRITAVLEAAERIYMLAASTKLCSNTFEL